MENFDESLFSFFDDDEFIKWITANSDYSNACWKTWMQNNPDRVNDLFKAKQIAQDLSKAQKPLNAEKLAQEIWGKVSSQIGQQDTPVPSSGFSWRTRSGYVAAASIAGLVVAVSMIYYFATFSAGAPAGQRITNNIVSNNLNHVNNTSESREVYLVDGTKITLQPGASLQHAVFLQKDKREVYLDGDAFFEVAKDPSRPFYVYAHDIVLRVLGTSFNVTTNKKNGNITVLVKTGKVSVFKSSNKNNPEFILTPTQSIRYTAQTQTIVKSESDSELARADTKAQHAVSFDFEEAPITKIFSVLQEAYGINILYDEKIFSKCVITAPLHDEPFDEKLKIICEAVGAKYHLENNKVYVDGSACR